VTENVHLCIGYVDMICLIYTMDIVN